MVRKAVGRESVDEAGCWVTASDKAPIGREGTARETKPDQWPTPT